MTTDYQNFFDPKLYFGIYWDDPNKTDIFLLQKQHHFWSNVVKDKVGCLLEYGAGPTISRFITASHYVNNIIAAEYLQANRKALEDWIVQDPQAFNWRPSFEYVVQTLEGKSSSDVDSRESEVREKIKAIVPCDLKSSNRLDIPGDISAKYGPPFDVVSTSLTLESVVESSEEYKGDVAFLAQLVRPGGYLVKIGTIGCTFYTVGEGRFYNFTPTKDLVLESLEEAGISDIVFNSSAETSGDLGRQADESELYDGEGFFFAYGCKV